MTLLTDINDMSPGAIIELYELDATSIGDTIYRFYSGKNELKADITWQTLVYLAFPVEADGFEMSTSGSLPKPTLKIANVDGIIGALNRDFNDMVGAKLTRKRTLVKYLDAVNFQGGMNAFADVSQFFPDDVFYINRKISENRVFVQFELVSRLDLEGIKLPRRQIMANVCPWEYRDGTTCGYAGGTYYDVNGVEVFTLGEDVCGKKLASCKLRFGEYGVLPFGGFPGSGLF